MKRFRPDSGSSRPGGFTLIETALAMLVIGVGVLAIFGLGRHGLESSRETQYDQRCQRMANAIFGTLREYNDSFCARARAQTNNLLQTVYWCQQWASLTNEEKHIPFPVVAGMSESPDLPLVLFQNFVPAFNPEKIELEDWCPFYSLYLSASDDADDKDNKNNTNFSPVARGVNHLDVTLVIYPDGDTFSSEIRHYRTTLSFNGGLP